MLCSLYLFSYESSTMVIPSVLYRVIPAVFLLLGGCSALTQVSGSWANPLFVETPMTKLAIFTVGSKNFISKATIEGAVVKELSRRGVVSTASTTIFNPASYDRDSDGRIDDPNFKDVAGQKLAELGFDGVMIIAVKDVKQEERYMPGTVTYQPMTGFHTNGWYGYWSSSYERIETPGYTTTDVTAFAEVNVYHIQKNALAWAAQTETFNPTSLQDAAESFASAIVPVMMRSGVVKGN